MSYDPSDPHALPSAESPTAKPGLSRGAKLLIVLGIVGLVLILLCCGGLAVFFFYAKSYVGEAMSDDPAVVRELTARVASIDVPEELGPTFSMDMKVPFTDETMMTWVAYADESKSSVLVMASLGDAFGGQNEEQMRTQIEQGLRGQGMGQRQDVNITERYEREIEVRGQPVTFFFGKGEQADSDRQWLEVTGTFDGPNGTVMVMIYADEATLDEEAIVAMIESIE